MIEVIARRFVTRPQHQVFEQRVIVNGFNRLTPRAARAALEIAFGNANGGEVWCDNYGYRVYGNSARKVKADFNN